MRSQKGDRPVDTRAAAKRRANLIGEPEKAPHSTQKYNQWKRAVKRHRRRRDGLVHISVILDEWWDEKFGERLDDAST